MSNLWVDFITKIPASNRAAVGPTNFYTVLKNLFTLVPIKNKNWLVSPVGGPHGVGEVEKGATGMRNCWKTGKAVCKWLGAK
jgi:hypothetical protein